MKKLLISLLVAGVLVGAVYGAAAGLDVGGVDSLGSGSSTVDKPGGNTLSVTDVSWTLDGTDITQVNDIVVEVSNSSGGDDEGTCALTIKVSGAPFTDTASFNGPTENNSVDVTFSAVNLDAALIAGALDVTIICERA